jgi:peptidoglycan hydrolase CwlO-like protein
MCELVAGELMYVLLLLGVINGVKRLLNKDRDELGKQIEASDAKIDEVHTELVSKIDNMEAQMKSLAEEMASNQATLVATLARLMPDTP